MHLLVFLFVHTNIQLSHLASYFTSDTHIITWAHKPVFNVKSKENNEFFNELLTTGI